MAARVARRGRPGRPAVTTARTAGRLFLGSPLRRPRVARRVVAALLIALGIALVVTLLVLVGLEPGAIHVFWQGVVLAALASVVPVGILWYLDRREREAPWLYAVA